MVQIHKVCNRNGQTNKCEQEQVVCSLSAYFSITKKLFIQCYSRLSSSVLIYLSCVRVCTWTQLREYALQKCRHIKSIKTKFYSLELIIAYSRLNDRKITKQIMKSRQIYILYNCKHFILKMV